MNPDQLLDFWFDASNRRCWFRSTPAFDQEIRERFEPAWLAARNGQLGSWKSTPHGALALVILLDQVPLNMYRGQALAFATEAQSRVVADQAISAGWDRLMDEVRKPFFYLPFMHSETLADQERSLALFAQAGLSDNLRWARHHRDIVLRFGRFPHRNALLGRESTPEERHWLASGDAFTG